MEDCIPQIQDPCDGKKTPTECIFSLQAVNSLGISRGEPLNISLQKIGLLIQTYCADSPATLPTIEKWSTTSPNYPYREGAIVWHEISTPEGVIKGILGSYHDMNTFEPISSSDDWFWIANYYEKAGNKLIKEIEEDSYTILPEDNNYVLHFFSDTDVNIVVPNLYGFNRIEGKQLGEGQLIFNGDTDVNIRTANLTINKTDSIYSVFGIDKVSDNEWVLFGNLELL